MHAISNRYRKEGRKIAFVPTMGYLHDGHLSLVRKAGQMAEIVIVSIFVNPTQFGPNEDFERYPRDEVRDLDLLKDYKVDVVFSPTREEMYPEDHVTRIHVDKITKVLCAVSRPGHFEGVATVVMKLMQIVQPDFMMLGQKDYQQAMVIQQMIRDLNSPVEIIICPTVRESDGLAMSSRNTYLNDKERKAALLVSKSLDEAVSMAEEGETSAEKICERIRELYDENGLISVEYVEAVHPRTLEPVRKLEEITLIAVAVTIGKTRLIDNVLIESGSKS